MVVMAWNRPFTVVGELLFPGYDSGAAEVANGYRDCAQEAFSLCSFCMQVASYKEFET
jgi:radical SAM superfamily enzyme with C-terminal helix-hairpin-helix motif